MPNPQLIVQKYGGATLADPAKIKQVAKRIFDLHKSGVKVVVVVSAMGQTNWRTHITGNQQLIFLSNHTATSSSSASCSLGNSVHHFYKIFIPAGADINLIIF
jgi:aspartokinase